MLVAFLGILHALAPLSNDLLVPSLPLVARGVRAGDGDIQLAMTAVLIGFAAGQVVYGPLSDRFGRRPLLCFGLVLYALASILCAGSTNLGELLAGRLLQGLGGAAGLVLARAIILDRWTGAEASRVLSLVAAITFMMPVCAPLIGGYLAWVAHWPLVFWLQAAVGALCLLGVGALLSPGRGADSHASVAHSLLAYVDVVRDREVWLYMACMGCGHAGVMAFVSNSAFVFISHLGLQPHAYGLCFSVVMLGGAAGAWLNGRLVVRRGIAALLSLGTVIVAVSGTAALLATTVAGGLWAILMPSLCYTFGMAFIFSNAIAHVLSRFRDRAGSAAAVVGVSQFLAGALAASALSLNDTPSPLPLAVALAAGGLASAGLWWGWIRRRRAVRVSPSRAV